MCDVRHDARQVVGDRLEQFELFYKFQIIGNDAGVPVQKEGVGAVDVDGPFVFDDFFDFAKKRVLFRKAFLLQRRDGFAGLAHDKVKNRNVQKEQQAVNRIHDRHGSDNDEHA